MKTIVKIFLTLGLPIILIGCAPKIYTPSSFKSYNAQQLLAYGKQALALHNYKEATQYFEAIDALYPFAPEAKEGKLATITAYYKESNYASALAAADAYIHLYPIAQGTDYAYYIKGKINFERDWTWIQKIYTKYSAKFDLSNLRAAYVDFEILTKLFPKSRYGAEAKRLMQRIKKLLAQRELDIATFYFNHAAYVAAANRASYLVQHFSGMEQEQAALKIMLDSYRFLGAKEQERATLHLFQRKFPQVKAP